MLMYEYVVGNYLADGICQWCGHVLQPVSGHKQCTQRFCAMKGVNQEPCCQPDQPLYGDCR